MADLSEASPAAEHPLRGLCVTHPGMQVTRTEVSQSPGQGTLLGSRNPWEAQIPETIARNLFTHPALPCGFPGTQQNKINRAAHQGAGPALQSKTKVSGKAWGSEGGEIALPAVCLIPGSCQSHLVTAPCSWLFAPTAHLDAQQSNSLLRGSIRVFSKPALLCFGAFFQDIVKPLSKVDTSLGARLLCTKGKVCCPCPELGHRQQTGSGTDKSLVTAAQTVLNEQSQTPPRGSCSENSFPGGKTTKPEPPARPCMFFLAFVASLSWRVLAGHKAAQGTRTHHCRDGVWGCRAPSAMGEGSHAPGTLIQLPGEKNNVSERTVTHIAQGKAQLSGGLPEWGTPVTAPKP